MAGPGYAGGKSCCRQDRQGEQSREAIIPKRSLSGSPRFVDHETAGPFLRYQLNASLSAAALRRRLLLYPSLAPPGVPVLRLQPDSSRLKSERLQISLETNAG
jgi:hypothetical protein